MFIVRLADGSEVMLDYDELPDLDSSEPVEGKASGPVTEGDYSVKIVPRQIVSIRVVE